VEGSGFKGNIMRLVFAFCGALLPGLALAQTAPTTGAARCEQNYQTCVRGCGAAQSCMADCASVRAHCIQNPSTATQPRR
jgi:hypothetical protein